MKRIKLQLLILERGFTQLEVCQRLGWRKERLSRLIYGKQHLRESDIADLAVVLGVSYDTVLLAANWQPEVSKVYRACPWCDYIIPIISEKSEIETMDNVPDNCPSCTGPLEIVSEEDEKDREGTIWWLTRGDM